MKQKSNALVLLNVVIASVTNSITVVTEFVDVLSFHEGINCLTFVFLSKKAFVLISNPLNNRLLSPENK